MANVIDRNIVAYCDGACKGNPGVGGWGCFYEIRAAPQTILRYTDCGGKLKTTNSEMEIKALEKVLDLIPHGRNIKIYSDSTYVIKTLVKESGSWIEGTDRGVVFSGWISAWMVNGWKTKGKKEV